MLSAVGNANLANLRLFTRKRSLLAGADLSVTSVSF